MQYKHKVCLKLRDFGIVGLRASQDLKLSPRIVPFRAKLGTRRGTVDVAIGDGLADGVAVGRGADVADALPVPPVVADCSKLGFVKVQQAKQTNCHILPITNPFSSNCAEGPRT